MKTIVVDASVAIKWFVPEVHSASAAQLLQSNVMLIAPDLICAEIGNILWKKQRSKELTLNIASEILSDFEKLPLIHHESKFLLHTAWEIATKYSCTFYDSLYLALAKTEKCLLTTADRTLCNILKSTPLETSLLWVEDIKNIHH
jgi:predicted nucleic acid-binding protein